jgi:hypothetical protein
MRDVHVGGRKNGPAILCSLRDNHNLERATRSTVKLDLKVFDSAQIGARSAMRGEIRRAKIAG